MYLLDGQAIFTIVDDAIHAIKCVLGVVISLIGLYLLGLKFYFFKRNRNIFLVIIILIWIVVWYLTKFDPGEAHLGLPPEVR